MIRKNVAGQFVHIAGVNTSTGAIVSGATWTMRRCLDGTFAAGGATITEDTGTGFYKVALAQADTNGNNIGYFFTATNCVPVTLNVIATAADPTDSVRFGLTALPNAAAAGSGGVPVIGTGSNNFKSDASANVTFANTSIGSVTGSVGSVTSGVTVTTNNDKTEYTIAFGGIGSGAHTAAELNNIADAQLDRVMSAGTDSGGDNTTARTVRQALRSLRNKVSISTGTMTVTKEDDTTTSWTAATATTPGNPLSSIDPT